MAVTGDKQEKNSKILIVEDSPSQAIQLKYLLEESGYKVSVQTNGADALSHLVEHTPDLVISDILMPVMDGYELCRKIKGDGDLRGIPVLLLTQLTEPEDIIKGLDSGADNFVTKPYDPELLFSQIEYILINRTMRTTLHTEMGLEVFFAGKKHFVNSDRIQILDLLFSTYQNSLQQKHELERTNKELKEALDTINILHGILPICANCKKIRDDKGSWNQIEAYITEHSQAEFSHGICPECATKLYPQFFKD
ncbi:MAG: response regulator [Deltaproteobacteria bacterium]|uniref:Response regulator n=1 Tax=Candidatus Desulfacyla euxinica TaxID=2841693 RepID=A0A8J6MWS6_9DELT|nr:response regulator [Candidatus Desulfacyla euxinica]